MARAKGTVKYGLNLEVQTPAPLDARSLAPTKADLILADTWIVAPSTQAYTYTGMLVVVASDPTTTNNGIYMLKSRTGWADPEQWSKLSSETVFSITGLNITGLYNETADHVYMKADVVSVNGSLYYCLVDNTTNIKPTVTNDWQLNWALFQLKGSEGAAGATPTIGNNGNWYINGVDQLIKALGVNGITPHIENDYWYIGNDKQGKATGTSITIQKVGDTYNWFLDGVDSRIQAIGETGKAAIANINLCGRWNPTTVYTSNNSRTGKIDVVLASDNKMYSALELSIQGADKNPINDTSNTYWGLFAMYGSDGDTGETPYIKDGLWYIGTETVTDKTTGLAIRATGSLLTISSDGYWEIDGYKTDSLASLTTITERQISTTQNVTNIVENTINNINPRGVFKSTETYYHTNVAEENKTDVVVGSDGKGYFCLVEGTSVDPVGDTTQSWALFSIAGTPGTPGAIPELRTESDGHQWWYINGNPQHVRADGIDGVTIAGTNGRDPYIKENGMWAYKRVSNDGKNTVLLDFETTIKAQVDQPNIREGMWFVGDTPTFVQAKGENAIANINFRELWKVGEQYWNKNASVNNYTDIVEGADDNKYYCKVNHTSTLGANPCIQVDGVWVRNTSTEATSKWGKWSIKGSTGADGKNIELRWFNGKLQWHVYGTSTWSDLISTSDLRSETLSDISTPIGSVIMYAGSVANIPQGYLLADGRTVEKTQYYELVERLSGGNTAVSAVLPDLRARFIVGYHENDDDYNLIGRKGGVDEVKLTADQSGLPSFTANVSIREGGTGSGKRGIDSEVTASNSAMRTDVGEVKVTGKDAAKAHENRPPYYVLAYLIKATYYGEIKTPYDTYLQTVPEGQTPLQKVPWLETQRGETGIAGINYRFDYIDAEVYNEKDTVRSLVDGNAYYCKVDGTTGKEPSTNPSEWTIFVMRGAQGPQAPQVLVRYSENASTAEGSDWHATPTLNDVYARFSTDGAATFGSPIQFKGGKGDDAFPIKIQYSITGAGDWSDTATATSKYLRFSTDNGAVWSNVITIQGGSSVFTADIQANLPSGRYIGKYAYNALIPSNGKTFEEVLRDIVTDSIAPTVTVSASGSIPYNDAGLLDRNITITMNASSNNSGASITERKLYYRRVGDSTWVELKNQPGNSDITASQTTYIHNVKDLIAANNVKGFEYKLSVKDSINATKDASSNAVTPAGYSAASYTLSAFADTKEKGDVAKTFSGVIWQPAQNGVQVVSYELQYRIDGGAWVQFAYQSYATAPVMPITLGITTSAIESTIRNANTVEYRLLVISTSATGNQTSTITLGTTTLVYKNAFGYSASASPTLTTLLAMGNNALTNGKAKTVTATAPAGNYTYYAYCAAAGDLGGIVMDGVAAVLGAFSKQADITGTNSYGATVTYRIYKSNAPAAFTNNQLVIS